MIVVGLTGSVGMGKSTTAKMFKAEGVPVFDADAVVHALYEGEAAPLIEAAFPGVVRARAVDRNALAKQVVGNAAAMKRLEAIVHPLVRRQREAFLAEARERGDRIVVLDVPLLFETGGDAEVDAIVVVSAPEAVQKARVMARRGMTEERLTGILTNQVPDAEKRRQAHFIIETSDGLDDAKRQVRDVIAALRTG